jgi:hypothetical protein
VFAWASLDSKKSIRAQNISKQNPTPLPPSGLYMIFGALPMARLRRGTGTEFDLLPGQVSSISTAVQHVLALGEKWVMFDVENDRVELVDQPQAQCLFVMQSPRNQPHIAYVRLGDNYLRFDGSGFDSDDLPDAQTSGVEISQAKAPVSGCVA